MWVGVSDGNRPPNDSLHISRLCPRRHRLVSSWGLPWGLFPGEPGFMKLKEPSVEDPCWDCWSRGKKPQDEKSMPQFVEVEAKLSIASC